MAYRDTGLWADVRELPGALAQTLESADGIADGAALPKGVDVAGSVTHAVSPLMLRVGRGWCQSTGSLHGLTTLIVESVLPSFASITCTDPSVPRTIASPAAPRPKERNE